MDPATIYPATTELAHIPWSVVVPIVVNLGILAYLFGGLSQRIRMLENDISRMKEGSTRLDDRVQHLALVMIEIKTTLTGLATTIEKVECPLVRATHRQIKFKEQLGEEKND